MSCLECDGLDGRKCKLRAPSAILDYVVVETVEIEDGRWND